MHLSLQELKEECLEYSKQISKDEENFFNLTDAAQINSYVFCNGATFSPKTSTQYIRGYIEGIRSTLGSCLVHILLVEDKMDNIDGFSRWHPKMKRIVNEKTNHKNLDDYNLGELNGQKEALEYIGKRYKFAS